ASSLRLDGVTPTERNAGVLRDERLETEPSVLSPMEPAVPDQAHENPIADLDRNAKQFRRLRKSERRSRHLVEFVPDTVKQRPPRTCVATFSRQRRANRLDGDVDDLRESCVGWCWLLHGAPPTLQFVFLETVYSAPHDRSTTV